MRMFAHIGPIHSTTRASGPARELDLFLSNTCDRESAEYLCRWARLKRWQFRVIPLRRREGQ